MKNGHITAIKYAGSDGRKSLWLVRCDCGKEFILPATEFLKGKTKSCGCMRTKYISEKLKRHGLSKTPFWTVWHSMLERCTNPNAQAWKNYGGRGIKVCSEWHSFENFRADMEPTYKKGLTLDRIDVNGNYCKSNCRWVTAKEQSRNKRNTLYIETPLGRMKAVEAAEISGINYTTLLYRVAHNWPIDLLFLKPCTQNRPSTT
jgi:hypothetical protein